MADLPALPAPLPLFWAVLDISGMNSVRLFDRMVVERVGSYLSTLVEAILRDE